MAQDEKLVEPQQKPKSNKAWIGWALLGAFIVGSIVFMMVIDAIYAPGVNNPATLPKVVGK